MRFLVDECTGPAVAKWLRQHNHDVVSVYEQAQGLPDDAVIGLATDDDRILITNDKDFGEKAYRDRQSHRGVILLRLEDDRPASKIAVLSRALALYGQRIQGSFVVVSERRVRFARRRMPRAALGRAFNSVEA
jgi:predicted nuclease of predicted toxin-antitoxin system